MNQTEQVKALLNKAGLKGPTKINISSNGQKYVLNAWKTRKSGWIGDIENTLIAVEGNTLSELKEKSLQEIEGEIKIG